MLDKELQKEKMSNSCLNEIEAVKEIEHFYCAYKLQNAGSQQQPVHMLELELGHFDYHQDKSRRNHHAAV